MVEETKASVDLIGEVGKAATVLRTVMEIAEKTPELKAAGTNVAKAAQTVTALVNNCLLPIAAVNFAFEKGREYFANRFESDLKAVTKDIPVEFIVEPRASLAAPILQGLTFSHEEDQLKNLYLNLLASAMNASSIDQTHPAFVEVIRQLTAEEAILLQSVLTANISIPIARIKIMAKDGNGHKIAKRHVLNFTEQPDSTPVLNAKLPAMVDNWLRLGLISVSYSEFLVGEGAYLWVDARPEMTMLKELRPDETIEFDKGILQVSDFGIQFSIVALPK